MNDEYEEKCDECGGPTDYHYAACKGACSSERYYGNYLIDLNTEGLLTCNCCEKCRWECHDSFMESIKEENV
jgi:hypothetical protein